MIVSSKYQFNPSRSHFTLAAVLSFDVDHLVNDTTYVVGDEEFYWYQDLCKIISDACFEGKHANLPYLGQFGDFRINLVFSNEAITAEDFQTIFPLICDTYTGTIMSFYTDGFDLGSDDKRDEILEFGYDMMFEKFKAMSSETGYIAISMNLAFHPKDCNVLSPVAVSEGY